MNKHVHFQSIVWLKKIIKINLISSVCIEFHVSKKDSISIYQYLSLKLAISYL